MFFKNKYEYDKIENYHPSLFEKPEKRYYYMDKINVGEIVKLFQSIRRQKQLNPNDMCFLGLSVKNVRLIDEKLRKLCRLRTRTTFETEEVFQALKSNPYRKILLDEIRRNKKFNFWMESGTVKLSTVHSFKGWELQTGILIIDEDDMNDEDRKEKTDRPVMGKKTTDELIYTALTRVRENLIVINIGNQKYDAFFRKQMPVYELNERNAILENRLAI